MPLKRIIADLWNGNYMTFLFLKDKPDSEHDFSTIYIVDGPNESAKGKPFYRMPSGGQISIDDVESLLRTLELPYVTDEYTPDMGDWWKH